MPTLFPNQALVPYGGFLSHGGAPKSSTLVDVFHYKSSILRVPRFPIYGNHHVFLKRTQHVSTCSPTEWIHPSPRRVWHAASCHAPPKRPDLTGETLQGEDRAGCEKTNLKSKTHPHVCAYIYICICICICLNIIYHIYICMICIYIYIYHIYQYRIYHMCTHIYIYIHTHNYIYTYSVQSHAYTYVYTEKCDMYKTVQNP